MYFFIYLPLYVLIRVMNEWIYGWNISIHSLTYTCKDKCMDFYLFFFLSSLLLIHVNEWMNGGWVTRFIHTYLHAYIHTYIHTYIQSMTTQNRKEKKPYKLNVGNNSSKSINRKKKKMLCWWWKIHIKSTPISNKLQQKKIVIIKTVCMPLFLHAQ